MSDRIGVLARRPEPGRVRTRLSPALPPAMACDLHAARLADTLAVVAASAAGARVVCWLGAPAPPAGVPRPAGVREASVPEDPAAALAAACAALLTSPGDRAVILAADAPALGPAHLARAFAALDAAPLAVAPLADGGCAVIALTWAARDLVAGCDPSAAGSAAALLARARAAGTGATPLETFAGLETPDELARYVAEGLADPARVPPATRAALAAFKLLG